MGNENVAIGDLGVESESANCAQARFDAAAAL
jgi:hypothetical protein